MATAVPLRTRALLDLVIVFLALVSVGIGVYEIVYPVTPAEMRVLGAVDLTIVAVFILEFTWSAYRSGAPLDYARRHWIELPAMIPVTSTMVATFEGVPFLRALRLVRLARLVRILRLVGAFGRFRYAVKRTEDLAARAGLAYVLLAAVVSAALGAVVLYAAERGVNPRVNDFADALWWAGALITTVGPGDVAPVTGVGRLTSVVLMGLSIAISGVFTALLAAALLTPGPPRKERRRRARRKHRVSGRESGERLR